MSPDNTYTFLSWVRQGLMATGSGWQRNEDRLTHAVTANVNDDKRAAHLSVKLYGPGDIAGIDPRQVVRTEPRHLTTGFEPNYFPFIEFDRPDFPWLFSPEVASEERLAPWLCLVVMLTDRADLVAGRPLPVLTCPRGELPDLAEAWAWAHAQVTWSPPEDDQEETLKEKLRTDQPSTVSRLLCPRRLQPGNSYVACVVPTFDVGVQAGLNRTAAPGPDDSPLKWAWESEADPDDMVQLPVYYSWEFITGSAGDFESSWEKLTAWVPGEETGPSTLTLNVSDPGWGLEPAGEADILPFEGVLRLPRIRSRCLVSTNLSPIDELDAKRILDWFGHKFEGDGGVLSSEAVVRVARRGSRWIIIDGDRKYDIRKENNKLNAYRLAALDQIPWREDDLREALNPGGATSGVLTPPIYGSQQTGVATVPAGDALPVWLRQLNLDPRYRVAAGLGVRVVQTLQEYLMAEAWDQAAAARVVNEVARKAQVAVHVGEAIFARRIQTLDASQLLQMTAPVFGQAAASSPAMRRVAAGPALTLRATLSGAALTGAYRRIAGPRNALAQRTLAPEERKARPVVSQLAEVKFASSLQPPKRANIMSGLGAWLPQPEQGVQDDRATLLAALEDDQSPADFKPIDGEPPVPTGDMGLDNEAADMFRKAAKHLLGRFELPAPSGFSRTLSAYAVSTAGNDVRAAVDPTVTFIAQAQAQAEALGVEPDAHPLTLKLVEPRFTLPMSRLLKTLFPQLMLSDAGRMPSDSVAVVETNAAFVAAFMVGLNHEMSRELAWREYPGDLSGTYFQTFWEHYDSGDGAKDMAAIKDWNPESELENVFEGQETGSGDLMVLLIRGDLLRRFPTVTIYAAEAKSETELGDQRRAAVFPGHMEPDITYMGFKLSPEEALANPGWFFVIDQQPTEPRFGLDESAEVVREAPEAWEELNWGHLADDQDVQDVNALTYIRLNNGKLLNGLTLHDDTWGANAATMAKITLQKPFRVIMHASHWLPPLEA